VKLTNLEGISRSGSLKVMVPVTYRPLLLYSRNNLPKKRYFSYPSNKTLPFRSRNKIVRGISDPIKTDRVINCDHLLDLATVLKGKLRVLI
jgi:hypothetical protein